MKFIHIGGSIEIATRVLNLIAAKFKVKKGTVGKYVIAEIYNNDPHDGDPSFASGYAFITNPDREVLEDFRKTIHQWALKHGYKPDDGDSYR